MLAAYVSVMLLRYVSLRKRPAILTPSYALQLCSFHRHSAVVAAKQQENLRNRSDILNRASCVPSSVFLYVLDNGLYFNLELCLYPILFSNKEAERQRSDKQFIFSVLVLVKDEL